MISNLIPALKTDCDLRILNNDHAGNPTTRHICDGMFRYQPCCQHAPANQKPIETNCQQGIESTSETSQFVAEAHAHLAAHFTARRAPERHQKLSRRQLNPNSWKNASGHDMRTASATVVETLWPTARSRGCMKHLHNVTIILKTHRRSANR